MQRDLSMALSHLRSGECEAAHRIVQEDDSELASWAHAIVHLMEGDTGNAGYWYRRAGRTPVGIDDVPAEIERLAEMLAQHN